jgi:hypothetical protein
MKTCGQQIMAMVFSIHGGKTSQHGIRQEGIAIRHHDVRRRSVGAMAFYLYGRLHVNICYFCVALSISLFIRCDLAVNY